MSGPATKPIIREALQQAIHHDEAGEAQSNVVTRWVCVVESMDPNGRRWLSRVTGDAGDSSLTEWDQQGLLFNALHSGGWSRP